MKQRNTIKSAFAIFVAFFTLGMVFCATAQEKNGLNAPMDKLVGSKLPDFDFQTMDGKKINLQSLHGKVAVLNFWFIACAPCIGEMPMLNELVQQYKNNPGVVFLSFAIDPRDDIKKFLQSTQFSYQVIPDAYTYDKNLGISAFPTQLVLDKNGVLVKYSIGGYPEHTKSLLTASIENALR